MTTSTTAFEFGRVVLVRFPFTDQVGSKQRPAVVISADAYAMDRRDVVLMAVTSRTSGSGAPWECVLQDWQVAGLLQPSVVKSVIATFEQSLVARGLGTLSAADQQGVRRLMSQMLG